MLQEYKQACFDNASLIPGWKDIDKNELCRLYAAEKARGSYLADSYLSAIIYKFWNVTAHNYYSQPYKQATEGDCVDWTTVGILYALEHHVWDDENNVLYNDPKGPEKAINTCIYSMKVNFYQKIKHQKERVTYEALSLDQLVDATSDSYYLPYCDSDNTVDNYIQDVVRESFNQKEYFKAFVLDGILNQDVFDTIIEDDKKYTIFSDKKLRKHLRSLDKKYCRGFSLRYNLDTNAVEDSIHYITELDYSKLAAKLKDSLKALRRDKKLLAYLVE